MSSTSGVSSGTSTTSGTLGNAPPVSFPGVSSGIDYNSIIEKYTADTLLQEQPVKTQITNLNAQNTALLKITNLIGSVQDSLTALSDPTVFGAFKANVSNTSSGSPAATASQIKGQTPIAGTYTINAQTAATSTTIVNNPNANAALIPGPLVQPAPPAPQIVLANQGTAIVPSNGTGTQGQITINGVAVTYNVDTQSIEAIVANINTALQANDGGTATLERERNGHADRCDHDRQRRRSGQSRVGPQVGFGAAQRRRDHEFVGHRGYQRKLGPQSGQQRRFRDGRYGRNVHDQRRAVHGRPDQKYAGRSHHADQRSAAGVTATYNAETSSIELVEQHAGSAEHLAGRIARHE